MIHKKQSQKDVGMIPSRQTHFHVTLLLLFLMLLAACSQEADYRVTIENHSTQTIDEFLLLTEGKTIPLGPLHPKEKITQKLTISGEGGIDYQFKIGENCHSGKLEEQDSPDRVGDKTLIIKEGGRVHIIDKIHHTDVEKPATKKPEEWALPCMIPG